MPAPRLVDRSPVVPPETLVAGLVPPPRFARARFETYLPEPSQPTQAAAVRALQDFAARLQPPTRRWFGRERTDLNPRGFVQRYVFPDGELHEIGNLAHSMQTSGFEVRHIESLREHYARTLRCWGANLDDQWTRAATMVGEGRARVWKLYMAGSAVLFDTNRLQVHQVLAVKVIERTGRSGMPWRPAWDHRLASPGAPLEPVHASNGNATMIDLRDPTSTV